MIKQRTIKQTASAVGIGLHSGRKVKLLMRPAPPDTGIVFRRVDITPAVDLPSRAEAVNDTRLATTLNEGKVIVSTIEHLMSALNGLGIDNLIVEVDAPEIPIMDGSGATFVYLIRSAGILEQPVPRRFVRVKKTIEVRDGDKWARLEPHNGMVLDFAIAFGHPAIDSTVQHAVVDLGLETYEQAVSRARTFGFVSEVELLRSMGLAKGGTLENAIVMDEFRVLNVGGLRSDDEFVKHKILDAMGDLYVLGHPLLARYVAYKSGHALNNRPASDMQQAPATDTVNINNVIRSNATPAQQPAAMPQQPVVTAPPLHSATLAVLTDQAVVATAENLGKKRIKHISTD